MKCAKINFQCAQCGVRYLKRADRVRQPDYCSLGCRMSANAAERQKREKHCEICGAKFIPRPYQLRVGQGRFCSNACATQESLRKTRTPQSRRKAVINWHANGNTVPSGPENPCFTGRIIRDGYTWIWIEGRGYMAEHRYVMETILGRRLLTDEIVHHRNEDRSDNRPENLDVMSRAEHMNIHREAIVEARCKTS